MHRITTNTILGLALGLMLGQAQAAEPLQLCIYDPLGTQGQAYGYARDYLLQLPGFGFTKPVELKVYTSEAAVAEDFRAGTCDGAAMSNLRARQFNAFTGTLDAPGAVPTARHLNTALQALARPDMAPYRVSGRYEVIGLVPMGAAYLMVNDRKVNTLAKVAGKKMAVFDVDRAQARMVQQVGAQPVSVDLSTVASPFSKGQVDVVAAPAVMFQPLALDKGMTSPSGRIRGGIVRFPLMQVTAALLVNNKTFDDPAVNQKLREYVLTQLDRAQQVVQQAEAGVPSRYWIEVPPADRPGYLKLMREARIQLAREGFYDPRMLSLLKKIRCQYDPSAYECALNDE